MPVDESSSQDATLIDDDLVAALGFEPVSANNGHRADAASTTTERDGAVADLDVSGEPEIGEATVADGSPGASDPDVAPDVMVVVDGVAVSDDLPVDEAISDEPEVDELTVIDDGAVVADAEFVPEDPDSSEHETDVAIVDSVAESEHGAADNVDATDLNAADLNAADLNAADSVSSEESSGPSSFFDLDLDDDATAGGDVGVDPAIDTIADGQTDQAVVGLIDLDRLDGETDLASDGGAGPAEMADADSVFAADPPGADTDVVVGEHIESPDEGSIGNLVVTQVPTVTEPFDGESAEVGGSEVGDVAGAAVAATAAAPVKRRRRLRARKSRRVIRHIDPWSVLTFSVLFHMVVFAALLLSSVLVWNAAIASGMVENVESFIKELGDYETFEINADVMFRAAVVIAGMLTLASSVMVVLLTVVFNLISDLVGGIRVTVIEEETVRVPIDKKRSKVASD